MYQALYRKWRPKRFEDVVGQEHVTETLKRQVAAGRLSHAYIFVGTRGTGKTTCAKILAKAVNCEHPVNGDPCNECASCRGIDSGAILDIEELDAASNNGVENIRALRDEAVFTPASVRKRVYIIDEVHMLSMSAFNALLKILEEPPEHLIFILATTELRKVPPTILSRCQRFSFKRITTRDIRNRLAYVAEKENIDLTPDAADMLSRLADGSLRDALSLLDQCACGDTVDEGRVLSTIGLAGSAETVRLLDAVAAHNVSAALEIFDVLYSDGKDPSSVLRELSALMRDILLKKAAPKSADKLISGEFSSGELDKYSGALSDGFLIGSIGDIQDSLSDLTQSADKRTAAELCLIKLCLPEESRQTYNAQEPDAAVAAEPVKAAMPKGTPEEEQGLRRADDAPAAEDVLSDLKTEKEKSKPEKVNIQAKLGADQWQEIVKAVGVRIGPASYSFLSDKAHVEGDINGDLLEIRASSDFAASMIDTPEVTGAVRDEASKLLGRAVRIKVTVGAPKRDLQSDKLDELMKFGNVKLI